MLCCWWNTLFKLSSKICLNIIPGRFLYQATVPEVTQKRQRKESRGGVSIKRLTNQHKANPRLSLVNPASPGSGGLWRPFPPRAKGGAGSQLETGSLFLRASRVSGVLVFASFANRGASVPTASSAEQVKGWRPVREHVLWEAAESFPQTPAAKVQV